MQQPPWLEHAWRELGEKERAGQAHNARILELYRDAGHPEIKRDEVAWCAAFAGACLERSGERSTRSLLARSYLTWGRALDKPELGAITIFSRGADQTLGHVGFWIGETGESIIVLGGNQGDAVSVARMPRSRLLGLRWPGAMAETPQQPESIFEQALLHVLEMEGGYSDDPYDPGGPTNYGITLGELASWRGTKLDARSREALISELKHLTPESVREIYLKRYWQRASCDEIPSPLALMHFDAAVNHGPGAAMRMLQEAVGAGIDGEMGPETRGAARSAPIRDALESYAEIRRKRYRALPHFWRFGRGWLKRVDKTLARAEEQAKRTSLDPRSSKLNLQPSKGVRDMQTTTATQASEGKWWGHSLTIWGTVITSVSALAPVIGPLIGLNLSSDLVQQVGTEATTAAQALTALAGTILTIWGRTRATKPLERRSISIRL